jgi:asparagine synthase (glutamine-hydrolysing)
MCGILGSINHSFSEDCLALLKHRGPDDWGIETYAVNENNVCLGQRRLSILDLSPAGHQPMVSQCGNYAIIFNGEIYNHNQLRERITTRIRFRGHSDTESILYYLIENGIEGVKDFNGIFAFAFLDIRSKLLYLARDPFGVKPLYTYFEKNNNEIVFASEMRPLRYLSNNELSVNKKALASLLRIRYNASPETLFKEITKIRPGHFIKIDLSQKFLKAENIAFLHLPPNVPALHLKNSSFNKVVKEYGIQLGKAVERQLLSDVEVGILLSGGVDSAVVAALAKKKLSRKVKAFTIGFDGDYAEDEIEDAAHTARLLDLEHYYKRISFRDFLGLIKQCASIVEEPLGTTSVIPMYYLAELASEKVKVVLTGQGADEPLGGYDRYKLEILKSKLPFFLRNLRMPFMSSIFKNEQISRGIKSLGIKNDVARFLSAYEVFTNAEIQQLINARDSISFERISYYYNLLQSKRQTTPVEQMMAIDARMNLSDDLLNYTDKITMHFGLECRVPMLDCELVNFIESLPIKHKRNMKAGKIIHKQFAEQLLPAEIVHRPKKGFRSPTEKWFREESAIIKNILLEPGSTFSAFFNQQIVQKIIQQHQNGFNKEKQIFLLLNIYYFLEDINKEWQPDESH